MRLINVVRRSSSYIIKTSTIASNPLPGGGHFYRSQSRIAKIRAGEFFTPCNDYESTTPPGWVDDNGKTMVLCMDHPILKRPTFAALSQAEEKPRHIGGVVNLSYVLLHLVSVFVEF